LIYISNKNHKISVDLDLLSKSYHILRDQDDVGCVHEYHEMHIRATLVTTIPNVFKTPIPLSSPEDCTPPLFTKKEVCVAVVFKQGCTYAPMGPGKTSDGAHGPWGDGGRACGVSRDFDQHPHDCLVDSGTRRLLGTG
jgi:hypothetical protein